MTTAVSGSDLADALGMRSFGFDGAVTDSDAYAAWVTPEAVLDVCRFLHDDPEQAYDLLSSVTAVDYVEFFDVVYHLTSLSRNASTVLKVRLYGRGALALASVTSVWAGAELQEREIYDLLGVSFTDHPNLKRMLTWEGFQGHPLRRDYLEPPLPYTWPHGG
jgi:NADH-quinone oxidoreductase subunit C